MTAAPTGGHPLDSPVLAAVAGPRAHQAHLGETRGRVAHFRPEVSPFSGLPVDPTANDWADVAALTGRGPVVLFGLPERPPAGWEQTFSKPCLQMLGPTDTVVDPDEAGAVLVTLGYDDLPEILDLVARTEPGPFAPRTLDMGRYVGARDEDGRLVAMAGERMHPPGFTEISAVCTDPSARGRGLGLRLVRAVAAGIVARRETPYLHVVVDNRAAISVYEQAGFVVRREIEVAGFTPG